MAVITRAIFPCNTCSR